MIYIKDIVDFINIIDLYRFLLNVLLIMYDVISMNINMEFNELLSVVYDVYNNVNKSENCILYLDVKDFFFLIRCVLDYNYFEFDRKYYK